MITPSDYNGNQAGFNPVIGKESCGKMVMCLGSIYHPTLMMLHSPVAVWCGNRFSWVRRSVFGQFALASHPAEIFRPSPKNYIHAGKPVRMHLPERRIEDSRSCLRLGATPHYFSIPDCIYRRDPQTNEFMYISEAALNGPLQLGDTLVY